MSSHAMRKGINTIIMDPATAKQIFHEWLIDQFMPLGAPGLKVTRVHVTRSGRFHVTLAGCDVKLVEDRIKETLDRSVGVA